MHALDRRSAARRTTDQGAARNVQDAAVSNRRRTDRRVSAVRKRLTPDQLDAIHADATSGMRVLRVTYVLNGACFAWLAEVEWRKATDFIAGAATLEDDAMADDALAAVILAIRERLLAHHQALPPV